MNYLRPRQLALSLLVLAVAWAMALPAFADPLDVVTEVGTLSLATNLNSTATLTFDPDLGTYSLDLNITNNSSTTASINGFALQLFIGPSKTTFINTTSSTLPSGWEFFDDQKINNNGTTGCTGVSHPGWLCADDSGTSPADILASGGTLDFLFSGTFNGFGANPLDLMANGLKDINNSKSKWAVSAGMDMQTPPPPPPVPEPASLFLLGSGLLGVGTLLRRKRG